MNISTPGTHVFFDFTNHNWNRNNEYNLLFLQASQNYANDLLRRRGHLLVNDVFDILGVERTSIGAIVGWTAENGHVDFHLEDAEVAENGMIFSLNPEGVVYHKIDRTNGAIQRKQIRAHITYPMLGDCTGLEWARDRLDKAKDDGLIQKWEFVSEAANPSGIIKVRFFITTVIEYPVTDAPSEQSEVIYMTLEPIVNKIVNDTDATVDHFRLFNI